MAAMCLKAEGKKAEKSLLEFKFYAPLQQQASQKKRYGKCS